MPIHREVIVPSTHPARDRSAADRADPLRPEIRINLSGAGKRNLMQFLREAWVPASGFGMNRPDRPAAEIRFGLAELAKLRRIATSLAHEAGLAARRADEFALAVNEIATNAIVHGRPPATMRIWISEGEVVSEVTDAGGGIEDRSAGRFAPRVDAPGGRGLWLARTLVDALEIRNGTGCTVSLRSTADGQPAATG
jgi:serine/threonine-protein kinase RsbW